MISVCITLGFSLRHLSNLEDHACIVVQNYLPYKETTTNKEKQNKKEPDGGCTNPCKEENKCILLFWKCKKRFIAPTIFFSEKIETPSEEGRQNYCPKVKPH